MMGKTHIAVGIATAYLIMQPKTISEFAVATAGGSIGGVMADIDVHIDRSNKYALKASLDALYGEILAIAISIGALAGDYFTGGNVLRGIIEQWKPSVVGALMFIALTVIGEKSKHRDRTHSLLACALFSISVALIEPHIGIGFAVGYASHLIIDLFNKAPVRILYPKPGGICFKRCYADRLGNELFLVGGVFIIILYTFLSSL